jgi:hypothetical protein
MIPYAYSIRDSHLCFKLVVLYIRILIVESGRLVTSLDYVDEMLRCCATRLVHGMAVVYYTSATAASF